jgi:hypothetical protein
LRGGPAGAKRLGSPSVLFEHGHDPIVFIERQAAKDDGVHDGEDGGRGTYSERQNR